MAKLQFRIVAILVGVLAATVNGSPAKLDVARRIAATPSFATATTAPVTTPYAQLGFEADLKRRADSTTSVKVANSFTMASLSLSLPGPEQNASMQATSVQATAGGMAIGQFTAADGGLYEITSQSGYVVIDYKTLHPGDGALIGNEQVSDVAAGVVANGQTIPLTPVTTSATVATSSSPSASASTTGGSSAMASSGSMSAASSASAAASASSSAGAMAPRQTMGSMMAAAGGLLGLMIL
ncbi:hypothetical protein LTR62_005538 [Meristemomyces frigidus]|uniref:Uncharacterized protein n=1 Tax=Meristemomyces frigidus TaxID=1508187 RepID=A0AAN7TDF2_9PEZI|nr:hypothetical protein LTR62_005538 [Meristemomyces frigidus]